MIIYRACLVRFGEYCSSFFSTSLSTLPLDLSRKLQNQNQNKEKTKQNKIGNEMIQGVKGSEIRFDLRIIISCS